MLEFLSGKLSYRKRQLYMCGGLRMNWALLYDISSRNIVDLAERAADGHATAEEIKLAAYYAECPTFGNDFDPAWVRRRMTFEAEFQASGMRPSHDDPYEHLVQAGVYTRAALDGKEPLVCAGEEIIRPLRTAALIAEAVFCVTDGSIMPHLMGHMDNLKHWPGGWLVREIFGNPFRPFVVESAWLAWDGGTVSHLARGIYDESAFDRLPVLADALEDAGCDDRAALDHCRSAGPHVKGCWVVDAVLGLK